MVLCFRKEVVRLGVSRKIPVSTSPKIIVDDLETKKKLVEIAQSKGESMKQTIVRLVGNEFDSVIGENKNG